jgi:hypothetical protein
MRGVTGVRDGTIAVCTVGCVIALCVTMSGTAIAEPLIIKVEPSEFVASSLQKIRVVKVLGYRIWEGDSGDEEFQKRTAVFIRRNGAFESVKVYGSGYSLDYKMLELDIPQVPWFATPGTFEVMVKVDGKESNYFQVPVLAGPPSIDKVTPKTITISGEADSAKLHEIRIVASNMGSPMEMSVLLDGKPLDHYLLGPGILTAFIPESAFKKSGKFGLQVKSSAGLSEPFTVTLTRPPLKFEKSAPAGTAKPVGSGILPLSKE